MKKCFLGLLFMIVMCGRPAFAVDSCAKYNSLHNPFPCTSPIGDGNCTWWAARERPDLKAVMNHDAKYWLEDAVTYNYVTGTKPIVGSVVVFPSLGSHGHVAYVTKVISNTKFEVTEMNYNVHVGMRVKVHDISSSNTDARFIYKRNCMYLNSDTGVLCHDYYESDGSFWWPEDAYNFVLFTRNSDKTLNHSHVSTTVGRGYFDAIASGEYPYHGYVDLAEYKKNGDEVTGVGSDYIFISNLDQGYIDPVSNHKHEVGLHYVKYKMSGQKNWHKGTVDVDENSNQKLNIRVKVKEKEGWEQSNIYVDLYHSENRWFSRSHDTKIDTKRIKKLGKKEKESVYFHNIDISNLEVGHHYYFADIRYGDKHNISSRSDKTEFVAVNVEDVNYAPTGYVDSVNCNTISGWADDEDTSSPLNVHIYDGATFLANIYADDYRSDVGNHAFTYVIPESHKDGTRHNYRVFAINEPQGTNPLLSQGSFYMSCGNNGAMPTTRFYNSKHKAQFYSINPTSQSGVPNKYPGWEDHGTSFNAFPNSQAGTVPLYTCWTGSTHDYDIDITKVGDHAPCKENPWRMFDVYEYDGEGRKPIYLMYSSSANSQILSNGLDDAYYLQNTHGFAFTSSDPLFWAPISLIVDEVPVIQDEPLVVIELNEAVDEVERKQFNQANYLLLQ